MSWTRKVIERGLVFDDQPVKALVGLAPSTVPTSASAFVTVYPQIDKIQDAVAAQDMATALTLARAVLQCDALLPLWACTALFAAFGPLVPGCPRPMIEHDAPNLEAVLLDLRECARRYQTRRLEDAVATPLYRLYEGIGRYDRARSVLAALLEAAVRRGDSEGLGVTINNLAYENLLDGRWQLAASGFVRARAAFKRSGAQSEIPNVRANILTCRFSIRPASRWHELLPELRRVNRLLCEHRDWRARKTLILLARYAEARDERAAAIGWARRAVRAGANIPTQHRIDDEHYLRLLERGRRADGAPPLTATGSATP